MKRESIGPQEEFAVGNKVYLQGCSVGVPGRVLRIERNKLVILWPDLDYIGRHRPESLLIAVESGTSRKPDCDQLVVEHTSTLATTGGSRSFLIVNKC